MCLQLTKKEAGKRQNFVGRTFDQTAKERERVGYEEEGQKHFPNLNFDILNY